MMDQEPELDLFTGFLYGSGLTGVVWPPQHEEGGQAESSAQDDLRAWWMAEAESQLEMLLPKVGEYSAYDLELIGRVMADTLGWRGPYSTAALTEIGIAFYQLGKIGRIVGAIREGRLPSRDSWLDSAVYSTMALRTRDAGAWPGKG